ncbi:D-alanine--D-alanine ligase [Thalassotalea euphylliae]|uniref:D-alanine--D-alanine ligase n=1 Tax=Thalassotalea euphylliae TaxID=1655234 RepID=A0A3E0UI87_9GAMM|nr:D-alanine--D-alanine ligase [Thalassotalea euphylliae]REL36600.1 D-alanine--D-alanine ligase [Thalassotalea euphylliae]
MTTTKNIAVLYGGTSAEREVSLNSGKAIANGLVQSGYHVELIDTKSVPLSALAEKNIDCVFIALHGRGGEDGCLQGALEFMGLNYTGSGVLGSALCMDKVRTKQVLLAQGLPTAPFKVIQQAQFDMADCEAVLAELGGVAMVKPAKEGSSIGMAKVTNAKALENALIEAFGFDERVLVEAWIHGPEYTVSILGDTALPAIHMETPREFYDYEAKYQSNSTLYHCPSGLPEQDEQALQALAKHAFDAVDAQGWGRVDVMRNEQGDWQVLEVNTVPGMTETSLVPKAAQAAGIGFSELVSRIAESAGLNK